MSKILLGDKPIDSENDDVLGLAPFADALAISLTEMAPDDGLVISVEGEWGSGKTSAIQLTQRRVILRELARELNLPIAEFEKREWTSVENDWNSRAEIRRTHLIRFNPWNFSGQENLVKAFFQEVGRVIGHPSDGPIAHAIKKITDHLPNVGTVIGGGVGAFTVGTPGAGVGATAGRAVGEAIQRSIGSNESLETGKRGLADALRQSGKRIIVIIDDLDRLLPSEMRTMFSIVKSLGDLPNVIYVLSFDRESVVRALSKGTEPIDAKFLEKIVQVPLKLPPPWRPEVQRLFLEKINAIIENDVPNDVGRWRRVYTSAVDPYIQTPRDVARFSNTLQVIWPNVRGDVDLADLICLTALQLFEPSVYQSIFDNIEMLAGDSVSFEEDKIFAARFEPNKANKPEVARQALCNLFPKLAKSWSQHIWDGTLHINKREQRRVCTREYYRNYFLFGLDPDRVTRAEIEAIVLDQNPLEPFAKLIAKLGDKGSRRGGSRVGALLNQILELVFTKPLLSDALVRAILDLSDDLILRADAVWELFLEDNYQRVRQILTFGLEPLTQGRRDQIVELISLHPNGITMVASVIEYLGGQHGLYGGELKHENERCVSKNLIEDAVAKILPRIREIAQDGRIILTPRVTRLLWIWRHLTNPDEIKSWFAQQIKSDEAILRVAEILPNVTIQPVGDGSEEVRSFSAAMYAEIMNFEEFKNRLNVVAEKAGSNSEAARIRSEFLAAVEAGEKIPYRN